MNKLNKIKSIFSKGAKVNNESVGDLRTYLTTGQNSKFARDIYSGEVLTMSEEFAKCKKAYRENALVHSAVETMADLILGDEIKVATDNLVLKKFMEDYYFLDSGFREAVYTAIKEAIITGNGYLEIRKTPSGKIKKIDAIVNSEDMYIDYDYKTNEVKRYVQKVIYTNGSKIKGAKTFSLLTPQGYTSVTGFEIPAERIVHLKLGTNSFGVYGRSDIAAVLDSISILDTIEKSIAILARYKAIPKKALSVITQENETPLTKEELDLLGQTLKNQSDFENPLLNRKFEVLDLSSGGGEIRLEGYIDYLKRNITVNMAPEFLIHGQDVNRATSKEQKQTYFLRINSKRKPLESILTKLLKRCVASQNNNALEGDFQFNFGEFDIILPEEKEAMTLERYNKGLITLKEAREALELPVKEGTDLFYFELTQPQGDLPDENQF